MSIEGTIDDLIEAGWVVLDSDFDPVAFQHWRRRAVDCFTPAVGPDHLTPYILNVSFDKAGRRTFVLSAVY